MALIALVVVVGLGLLALGFFAPGLSRRLQARMDHSAERAKAKAEEQPEPLRTMTKRSLEFSHRTADRATNAGREGRYQAERTERTKR